jgi:hypothetical protein
VNRDELGTTEIQLFFLNLALTEEEIEREKQRLVTSPRGIVTELILRYFEKFTIRLDDQSIGEKATEDSKESETSQFLENNLTVTVFSVRDLLSSLITALILEP